MGGARPVTLRVNRQDIADLVTAEYDPLPAVVDARSATRAQAPRLYEEWPDNVVMHQVFTAGDPAGALAEAAVVVRRRFVDLQ